MTRRPFDRFVKKYGTPVAILISGLFVSVSIYVSFGMPKDAPAGGEVVAGVTRVEVFADDDAVLGETNAPVTIIEFSDFECPYCRQFWRETFPELKSKYIDTGKVKFVYRDFPLDFHPGAGIAAEGAECAREQGMFWQFHDEIFKMQDAEGQGTITFGAKEVKAWAKSIVPDARAFDDCLDSRIYQEEVTKDRDDGIAAGVTGTPGFFVNGRPVIGAVPFSVFEQVIESELSN